MKIVTTIEMSEEERKILEEARDVLCDFECTTNNRDVDILDGRNPYDEGTLAKTINYLDYLLGTE